MSHFLRRRGISSPRRRRIDANWKFLPEREIGAEAEGGRLPRGL